MKKSELKKYIKSSLVNEARISPDNRVAYLEQTLDYVWKMGKGNNIIDFKSLAQSLINDMFDEESLGEAGLYTLKNPKDTIKGLPQTTDPDDATENSPAFKNKYKPVTENNKPTADVIKKTYNEMFGKNPSTTFSDVAKKLGTDEQTIAAVLFNLPVFESEEEEEGVDTSMDKVSKALSAVQKKLDQMFADFKMGKMDKDEYMSKRKELQAKRDKLNAALMSFEEDEDEI